MPVENISDDEVFRIEELPQSTHSFVDRAAWVFPILGLLVFEVWSDSAAGVSIACLKFGWTDFVSAWRLRRDLVADRRSAMQFCHLGRGYFTTAGAAAAVLLGIAVFEVFVPAPQRILLLDSITAGLIMLFSGILLGGICSLVGLSKISRVKLRPWLGKRVQNHAIGRRPQVVCTGYRNGFRKFCLTTAVVSVFFLAMCIGTCIESSEHEPVGALIATFAVFGLPPLVCIGLAVRCWQLAANRPEECWNIWVIIV